jgi:hypothetical protein
MHKFCLEYPETAGKIVEHVRYIFDPSGPPEVDIRFTDGMSLSLKLQVDLKVEAELYRTHEGDVQTLKKYPNI